ncbi:EAL domain-containing protein [Rhodopseudomonas palustris]|uniref:Diguanylate phosphodiesterase n=1 Tax=Rhodopseudomonas palustris (strain BisB18) TaxID=316056 RepID=Q21AX1_RHOPB
MIRISTIFIAICMVLVSASLGMVLYSMARFSFGESALVAMTTLTFLVLYNAVAMRLRDRSDVSGQVADLSRGIGDLARQVAEFGRRLSALEGRAPGAAAGHGPDQTQIVRDEISELGAMVKQLANTVASHEDLLAAASAPAAPVARRMEAPPIVVPPRDGEPVSVQIAPTVIAAPVGEPAALQPPPLRSEAQLAIAVRNAIEANRVDIYLQPIVSLPQRKVRFYEAVTRLRDDSDKVLTADEFIPAAESAQLMGKIDHALLLRCMQVLRRLMVRNKEVGVFCNIAASTLANADTFGQCLEFLEANRALAGSFIIEFKQDAFRNLGPMEIEHVAALAQRGYRFSIDHVTDLRFDPRDMADRGVRFIKVPAALMLQNEAPSANIHPADLCDLLGRFGIDLIAERIEGERAVVDLLDFDVRFGQGFLFAAPRPLRPDAATNGHAAVAPNHDQRASHDSTKASRTEIGRIDPKRVTGNAALVRRSASPN